MTQQEFNILSKKYLNGETSDDEDVLLMEWFEKNPKSEIHFEETENKVTEKRIWRNIHQKIESKSNFYIRLVWVSGMAACLLIGLFFYLSPKNTQIPAISQVNENQGIEIKNTTSTEQEFRLTDGTIVWLKPNSSLVYDKDFNKVKRSVYFKGEAFFKVKRDVTKPFLVYSGGLVTEVLGTSFRIKPLPNSKEIEVAVSTGKVSVYTEKINKKNEKIGIILTPNQRIVFNEESKSLIPSLVETPSIITNDNQKTSFIFESESLQNVLTQFTELYGIEFIITNPNTKNCQITADLSGLSLFTQLDLICKSIDADYEKRGTTVFINGEGCQ